MGEPRRVRIEVQSGRFGVGQVNQIGPCPQRFTRARDFASLIELVRVAERFLAAASYTAVGDRVGILRGIYYGTMWSADYQVERSTVRNAGFQVYTGTASSPPDPRPFLICNLFTALQESQDLVNRDRRHVDVGHLMIGLHARLNWQARSISIPTQGGTGLELSTWLGDLGGGAGILAYRRASSPRLRATTVFTGSDFGGSINIEGDVAGFVVGSPAAASSPAAPTFAANISAITDSLAAYLSPASPSVEWNERATRFLRMYGATPPYTAAVRTSLIDQFASKIESFAVWYLINRLRQTSRLDPARVRAAATHLTGAAREVAEVFADMLIYTHSHPAQPIQARGAGPAPTPAGSPNAALIAFALSLEAAQAAGQAGESAEGIIDDVERRARELYRQLWQ